MELIGKEFVLSLTRGGGGPETVFPSLVVPYYPLRLFMLGIYIVTGVLFPSS